MKAKISLVIIGVMLFCGMAFADVIISLKDGNEFKWQHYTETKDSYCTSRDGGQFCFPKSDVASVKEAKGDEELKKDPTTKVESTTIPTKKQKALYKSPKPKSEY